MRADSGLKQEDRKKDDKMWLESGYVLKTEPTGYLMGCVWSVKEAGVWSVQRERN